MHCCRKSSLRQQSLSSEFSTNPLIGSSVRLPPCPCMPRPPTCLPFRLRSRWSGRAWGWPCAPPSPAPSQRRPSPPAVLICLELPPSHCWRLLKQPVRMSQCPSEDKTTHTAARVAAAVLCVSFLGQDESIRGEIPPVLVLNSPSISIMLSLSCLVL